MLFLVLFCSSEIGFQKVFCPFSNKNFRIDLRSNFLRKFIVSHYSKKNSSGKDYKEAFNFRVEVDEQIETVKDFKEIMEYSPICLYISFMIILQYFPCLKSIYLFYEQYCTKKGNLRRYYCDNNKIHCSIFQTVDSSKFHFKFLALFTSPYSILCAGTKTASLLVGIHPAAIRKTLPLT